MYWRGKAKEGRKIQACLVVIPIGRRMRLDDDGGDHNDGKACISGNVLISLTAGVVGW